MKIMGTGPVGAPVAAAAPGAAAVDRAAPAAAAVGGAGELQSGVLQPALAALKELPDIDHAKVAALREALARGEIPFDPAKLAGLIERHHGGHG